MASSSGSWTMEDNKRFEQAVARFTAQTPDRWQRVAEAVGGKSAEEVKRYYKNLVKSTT